MRSSGLYIHGSWKWQLFQLSINLGDTAQELNGNHMQEKLRRKKWARDTERGTGGERDTERKREGGGKVKWSARFCWLYSNKQNHMCICMCVDVCEGTQQLLIDQTLHIGVWPVIGGDGLVSFNSKLAVLVSEPDVQIKKVRHAHLILVNLPLHISPACQLLCDSNHHRHMPLLRAPLWVHPPRTHSSSTFLSNIDIYVSQSSHCQNSKCHLSKKLQMAVREGHLICSSTFRRMLNMAADDQLWAVGL